MPQAFERVVQHWFKSALGSTDPGASIRESDTEIQTLEADLVSFEKIELPNDWK